jgi:P27 family predicted phage terminase small subunit
MELSEDAQREWNRISPLLIEMGVLSSVDVTALAGYCECFASWTSATKMVRKVGAVLKSPSGLPIVSPYVAIAAKSLDQMRKFLVEFGMTPSSRSRIAASGKPLAGHGGHQDAYDFLVQ